MMPTRRPAVPRATSETVARRSAILAVARRHPDWRLVDIGAEVARLGHKPPARSTVHAVIRDWMPLLDPGFRKVNRAHLTYGCGVCGEAYTGKAGYSGANARRCPKCRRRKETE